MKENLATGIDATKAPDRCGETIARRTCESNGVAAAEQGRAASAPSEIPRGNILALPLLITALALCGCEARVRLESQPPSVKSPAPQPEGDIERGFSHGVLAGVAVYRVMVMADTPGPTNVSDLQSNAWFVATNGWKSWESNYVRGWLNSRNKMTTPPKPRQRKE